MPNANRVFPAGTGGNPTSPILGTAADLSAQPPIRAPPDPFVLKSVEPFTDDDNIPGFVDGQGNRIWHVDTSASAKAITFVSAADSTDFSYVVKWTKGANGLKILAAMGNVGGTTTFNGVIAGDAYEFRSDGIDYQLVAQATDQSYVTSNSLSAALAAINFTASQNFAALTVLGSSTFSGTAVFSTSLAVSGTASVGTLVVSGAATFGGTTTFSATTVFAGEVRALGTVAVSATASVGALVVAGVPLSLDIVKLGQSAVAASLVANLSGSWTAYSIIELRGFFDTSSSLTGKPLLNAYISDGTTRILTGLMVSASQGNSGAMVFSMQGMGNGAAAGKKALGGWIASNKGAAGDADLIQYSTATANSGFINEIGVYMTEGGTTKTISSGFIYAYGYK